MMPAATECASSAPARHWGRLCRRPTKTLGYALTLSAILSLPSMLGLPCHAQTLQAQNLQTQSTRTETTQPRPAQPERPPSSGGWTAAVKHRSTPSAKPRATALHISGDTTLTRVRMEVDRPISADTFTLDAPYRAIIDVPDLEFYLPASSADAVAGLVKDFRYGRFDAGRSRVVIDLTAPATIRNATFTPPKGNQKGVLTFEIVRVDAADFQALRGTSQPAPLPTPKQFRAGRHDEGPPAARAPAGGSIANAQTANSPASPRAPKQRPVVLIDPGHGGIDPGTVGAGGITEKSVTLAVAKEVRAILRQGRRLDVYLTREYDNFVTLDQRVKLSRDYGTDLFVSIHADSLAEKDMAGSIRGATVYTLSERASDDKAQRMAEKENAADIAAGLAAVPSSAEDQVRSILFDLVQRETDNYSLSFRNLLLSTMRGRIPLAKDPQRSAAFKVLKQDEVPAVLIELGYMSNPEDLARLGKPEGQRQLATAIASSITAFFAGREARSNR